MRLGPALLLLVLATPGLAQGWSADLLWQGFGYEWDDHPHRLSVLSSRYEVDELDRWTGELQGRHGFEVRIGSFPADSARYWSSHQAVRSRTVRFARGRVGPLPLTTPIDRPVEVSRRVEASLAGLGLKAAGPGAVEVVLAGFEIRRRIVHDHDAGWHFQGLGVSLGRATLGGDGVVRFDAAAFVHPANSPDPVNGFDYLGDWPAAWGPTAYDVYIDYVVVHAPRGTIAVAETTCRNASDSYVTTERFEDRVRLPGTSRFPHNRAFLGLSAFRFELDARTRAEGRYIRRLEALVDDFDYDAGRRTAAFDVVHAFSNRGGISYRWRLESSTTHRLIEVRDPDLETTWGRVDGRVATGDPDETEVLFD